WGLYTETSLDRKAGVLPQISDFAVLDDTNGFAFAYQFADNFNGYSWSDGTPTPAVTNTTTGVWTYGIPIIGTGFQITAPADTTVRTFKVYVAVFGAHGKFKAYLSDRSAPSYANSSLFNMLNGLVANSGENFVLENPAWSAGAFTFSFASHSGRAYEVQTT